MCQRNDAVYVFLEIPFFKWTKKNKKFLRCEMSMPIIVNKNTTVKGKVYSKNFKIPILVFPI